MLTAASSAPGSVPQLENLLGQPWLGYVTRSAHSVQETEAVSYACYHEAMVLLRTGPETFTHPGWSSTWVQRKECTESSGTHFCLQMSPCAPSLGEPRPKCN